MVDFQSRDTRRDVGDDDEDESTAEDVADEDTPATETARETVETQETAETAETAATEAGDQSAEDGPETLPFAVVTVAGETTIEDDDTGAAVVDAIEHDGGAVATRELISPSYDGVQSTLNALTRREDVDAVVTLGGTGVAPEDVTVDAAEPLFDKQLPGFGELYRVLSHDFEGTAVVRTRTTAGIIDGVPVFCLPGETEDARRGVEQIVLEEAETIADQAAEQ